MKLDIKLDKDDNENTKFSIDCDKDFSDAMGKCIEGWITIFNEAIKLYTATVYPTPPSPIHITKPPERKKGKIVIEEDENDERIGSDSHISSGDINLTATRTSEHIKQVYPRTAATETGNDPVVRDPEREYENK